MIRLMTIGSCAILALVAAVPVSAGEVTGTGQYIDINARSVCAYSGLNDNTPDPRDPGGRTQNFGTLVGQFGWIDPQNLDPNATHYQPIPGYACNPNRSEDLHAG